VSNGRGCPGALKLGQRGWLADVNYHDSVAHNLLTVQEPKVCQSQTAAITPPIILSED